MSCCFFWEGEKKEREWNAGEMEIFMLANKVRESNYPKKKKKKAGIVYLKTYT